MSSRFFRTGPVLTLFLAVACAPFAGAQTTSFTSPKGLATVEGNTVFYFKPDRRYQSIDASNIGSIMTLKSMAFRRDGSLRGGSTGASVNVQIDLGLAKSMARLFSKPDMNFDSGRTRVFDQVAMQLPNWSVIPAVKPAPFDMKFPFSTPVLYLGVQPLIWDMKMSGSGDTFPMDREYSSTESWGREIPGTKCGSYLQRSHLGNRGQAAVFSGMSFGAKATGAPANSMAFLSLDTRESSISISGWCGHLVAYPTVFVPFDQADVNGTVHEQVFATPFDNQLSGVAIFSQFLSLDRGVVRLSQGMKTVMPVNRKLIGRDAAYLWVGPGEVSSDFVLPGGTIVTYWDSK